MDIQITEEEVQAFISSHFPNYVYESDWRRTHIEQFAREELMRHRRYLLLEDNIRLFFRTEGLYAKDPEGMIPSQELYEIYKQWCIRQQIPLHPPREFWLHAKNHAAENCLVYSTYIPDRNGKRCRGFYGIRPLTEEEKSTTPK